MGLEKLNALRKLMQERGIQIYVVPTADFHESEYVGEYFKARKFLTGFTGSAGVAVVTMDAAGLWTDGRYFIQAERELRDSGFTLYKMGMPDVPTVLQFVKDRLTDGGIIGFDGRVVNAALGLSLEKIAGEKGGSTYVSEDLVGMIWKGRPALSHEKAWILDEKYAGESLASKMQRIREKMAEADANMHIVTSLDDIAWILNLRGNDVAHFPVVLSYLVITKKGCIFYVQEEALTTEIRLYLDKNGVSVAGYYDIYDMADMLSKKKTGKILLNENRVNYRIYKAVSAANEIVNAPDPSYLMKAVKNDTEIENIRMAHVKDGVAMVKWLYWLKKSIGQIPLTEVTAAEKLAKIRSSIKGFVDLSFDTIAAYEANGAMMHYSATPETAAALEKRGFLLVDSGAHYLEGSTDITRTIALGPITEEQRDLFTAVLRANLNLSGAKFLYGCIGQNLDILARGPLWELGLDYRCGTGHGIGYLLNVHEGPNGFRWKVVPERVDNGVLEEGMVTTDEPGVYLEGKFGIRSENELIVRKESENEYGKFMGFEIVTYVPFDLSAVDSSQLSQKEKSLLNQYHQLVYQVISPYLTLEEQLWLRYETREI